MREMDFCNTLTNNALELATKIHEGQYRKGSHVPYIVHPFEVALILLKNGGDTEMIAAALLHDTLEDGDEDYKVIENMILEKLNLRVLNLVRGASEELKDRENTPWEDRKNHTINYLKDPNTPIDIKMIGCADKLSNARSLYRDKKVLGDKLWDKFNRGYEDQKWYYNELVKSLSSLEEYDMYQQFKLVVKEIFNK